jgi:hypothetical protein
LRIGRVSGDVPAEAARDFSPLPSSAESSLTATSLLTSAGAVGPGPVGVSASGDSSRAAPPQATDPHEAARAARQIQHESAHAAAAFLLNWQVLGIGAKPGRNGWCEILPPKTYPFTPSFQIEMERAQIFLAANAWTRWRLAAEPERYAIVNIEPTADDVLAETGWTDTPVASYVNGSDEDRAAAFCQSVSASELSASVLLHYCELEATALVATPAFGVAVTALEDQPVMSGPTAMAILTRAHEAPRLEVV